MLEPGEAVEGLRIAEFELVAAETPGQYRYHVLLARSDIGGDPVRGVVEVQVRGVATGAGGRRERTISLKDLAEVSAYPLPFGFRYFQGLSGVMTLPDDFEPAVVLIRLAPTGRRAGAVRREFEWRPETG